MNNKWSNEEEKKLKMVLEEWLSEFKLIFYKTKIKDIENFILYSKYSFEYHNVFRYAYEIINAHPNWDEWENLVRNFYILACNKNINRRNSYISSYE